MELFSSLRWHISDRGYAQTTSLYPTDKFKRLMGVEFAALYFPTGPVKLHHMVIGQPFKGFVVDHINGNPLDNRRENLRLVDTAGNNKNRIRPKQNTSGHAGIYWLKDTKRWRAHITVDGKYLSLGCYRDLSDAVKVRKQAEIQYGFISR